MSYSPGHWLARGSKGAAFRDMSFLHWDTKAGRAAWKLEPVMSSSGSLSTGFPRDVWPWPWRLKMVSPFARARVGIILGKAEGGVW